MTAQCFARVRWSGRKHDHRFPVANMAHAVIVCQTGRGQTVGPNLQTDFRRDLGNTGTRSCRQTFQQTGGLGLLKHPL